MKIKVRAKYIRMSPRKIRLVADMLRGMDIEAALDQLKFINKRAARPLIKLINSAIANAEHNHEIKKENLFIDKLIIDAGPTLSRWMPRAFGRATSIRKKSSNINLILGEKVPSIKKKKFGQKKEERQDDLVKVYDYKSVPKGRALDIKGERIDFKEEHKDEKEKKDEPFDKRMVGKHRAAEEIKGKEKGKRGRGFIKKLFKRKSV